MDLVLHEKIEPGLLVERLKGVLPEGFDVLDAREVPLSAPSLMSIARGATYTIYLPGESREEVAKRVDEIRASERILIKRLAKKGKSYKKRRVEKDLDIRPMIRRITLRDDEVPAVDVEFVDVDGKPGKPKDLVDRLGTAENERYVRILKRETHLLPPSEWHKATPEVGALRPADADEESASEAEETEAE
jgi:radical SAM-linked protein